MTFALRTPASAKRGSSSVNPNCIASVSGFVNQIPNFLLAAPFAAAPGFKNAKAFTQLVPYSALTQSVRVSPSSSHCVGRALSPAAARAASGSPPNSGKPLAKRTFTARLKWKQS
jgi:hypothetical protein